jgi:hypothetical protein
MRHRSRRESDVGRARRGGARTSARRTGGLWASGRAAGARAPWASRPATGLVVGAVFSYTNAYSLARLVCELVPTTIVLPLRWLQHLKVHLGS